MIENIVVKGENGGNQYFLLSPQCFQINFLPHASKVGIKRLRINSAVINNEAAKTPHLNMWLKYNREFSHEEKIMWKKLKMLVLILPDIFLILFF